MLRFAVLFKIARASTTKARKCWVMTKKHKGCQLLHGALALSLVCAVPVTVTACAKDTGTTKQTPVTHTTSNHPINKNIKSHIQYNIQAKLNTDDMMITGKQTVKYRNITTDVINNLIVDIGGGIDIISVKDVITGHNLNHLNRNHILKIQLEQGLNKDDTTTVELTYRIKIPRG